MTTFSQQSRQPVDFCQFLRIHLQNLICLSVTLLLLSNVAFAQNFPANFSQIPVASGLSEPTVMAFAPDGRIFVAEQGGALRVVKNGSLLPTPLIQLSVDASGERGLIGIAIDPNFTTNQYIYLYYTVPTGGGVSAHNRVSRFTANGDLVTPGSETVLLDLENLSSATNHNGGSMAFGPDGKLYIGVGENANGANAQTLTNQLGKVLRINSDGTIPADNPFVGVVGALPRIWAYGLRNPYTLTFQPGTGRLFVNDVGQSTWEEVNDATAPGLNFGWPTAEGTSSNAAFTNPVFAYPHGSGDGKGCAITGGAFYNPTTATYPASYVGNYFYQDLCNNWINYIDASVSSPTPSPFATNLPESGLGLTLGNDGNLYYLSRGASANTGVVYKIIYTPTETETAPLITGQPTSLTVISGQAATFSVAASGTNLTYQWQKNGANIAGATSAMFTISGVSMADGGQYRAIVSNPGGSVTSNSASLTVQTIVVDPAPLSLIAPLYNCQTGAITFQTVGGNGSTIDYFAIGVTPWTTNPNQTIEAGLRADPKPIQLYARQSGVTISYTFDLPGFCSGTPSNQPPVFNGPLANQLVQQGIAVAIMIPMGTFTDPEGQPLQYTASGLPTGLTLSGNMIVGSTGQVGSFPITIRATDPGSLFVTGQFTLTVTPTSSGSALQLVAPLYNCQTGAITFQTIGGNGTTVEYFAIGITPWTANPNQIIEAGLRADPKMITLNARQSGVEISYMFNLPAVCASARIANPEKEAVFTAQVFPNPVRSEVVVGVHGAEGQHVRFHLTDLSGKTVSDQAIEVSSSQHRTTLNVANQPSGVYLLRVSTDRQAVTLKVLKQE